MKRLPNSRVYQFAPKRIPIREHDVGPLAAAVIGKAHSYTGGPPGVAHYWTTPARLFVIRRFDPNRDQTLLTRSWQRAVSAATLRVG